MKMCKQTDDSSSSIKNIKILSKYPLSALIFQSLDILSQFVCSCKQNLPIPLSQTINIIFKGICSTFSKVYWSVCIFEIICIIYNSSISMKKPCNYYTHKPMNISSSIEGLNDNYQLIEKIGEGAFGEVYKVFDAKNSQLKVIKKVKKDGKIDLSKEAGIMKELSDSEGFVKVLQFDDSKDSATNTSDHLVMSYLGANLAEVTDNKLMSVYSMKRIARQLVERLKNLHQHGYVHRDLKPQNILMGNQNDPHKVYLVDFGLATKYRKDIKKIRSMYKGVIGTLKFCPIASHNGQEQFPKDDLQSLGYVLIYLIKGKLPWKTEKKEGDTEKYETMKIIKEKASVSDMADGLNCFKKYFAYIRQLNIDSQIDYSKLQDIFSVTAKNEYCYEFCSENCFEKLKKSQVGEKEEKEEEEGGNNEQEEAHPNFIREFVY